MTEKYAKDKQNLSRIGERIPELAPGHPDFHRHKIAMKLTAIRAGLQPSEWMQLARAVASGRDVLGTVAVGAHVLALVSAAELVLLPPALVVAFDALDALHRAGCASPFWVLDAVVPLLGLAPQQPGVAAGSHVWHNAEHFPAAERHRFRRDMAATERIPLTWRGLPFSSEGGLALRAAMLQRGLREPHWLPAAAMGPVFGLEPLVAAERIAVDGLQVVHVSDTSRPALFDVRLYERNSVTLATPDETSRLSPTRHAFFLARNGLRADDATTRSWVAPALLRLVDPAAADAAAAAGASTSIRTAVHDGQQWLSAHDVGSSRLWHVLSYQPVFAPGTAALPRRQHVVLALHALLLPSRPVLWTCEGRPDPTRHAAVGSVVIDGRTLLLLEPREERDIEEAVRTSGQDIVGTVGK